MSRFQRVSLFLVGLFLAAGLPVAAFADPVITPEDPNAAVAGAVTGSVQTFGGVIAVVLGAIMGLYVAMLAYKWLRRQIGKGVHAKA